MALRTSIWIRMPLFSSFFSGRDHTPGGILGASPAVVGADLEEA